MEVSESDIIYSYSLESPSNPLGGTVVWVKADAEIQKVKNVSKNDNEFMRGDITSKFLTRSDIEMMDYEMDYDSWTWITVTTPTITVSIRICTRGSFCRP